MNTEIMWKIFWHHSLNWIDNQIKICIINHCLCLTFASCPIKSLA